jgi:hydroxysqualene dehydroxylase
VVVVGGGLAGVVAAWDCASAGANVTLVEVRPRLGGAAYSFERDGLSIDNGQHVFLRCCEAYQGLLARLGSAGKVSVQPRLAIPVLTPGGEVALLRRGSQRAPLHLADTLMRYRLLSLLERLRAMRAGLSLARLDPDSRELDEQTLGSWLEAHGQSERAVVALWDLIALPTLNLPAARASLALGAFVFQRGLLQRSDGADIGFHRRSLNETLGDPAHSELRAAGVEVKLGWRARRIELAGAGLEVYGEDGGLSAEAVVLAVPHGRAGELLPAAAAESARMARALRDSPIVNVHVVYDRKVCDHPFAAGVDTPVQYLFDRTEAGGVPAGMQYLAISVSGAERQMRMSSEEMRELYLGALARLFPRAREAKVERFLFTREHAATFRASPGTGALRPPARSGVDGLVLAGAWTATGWPATLEGAVLSGQVAAREAMR